MPSWRITRESGLRVTCVLGLVVLATACGGDDASVAGSGGSLAAPTGSAAAGDTVTDGSNLPPTIASVRLDPAEPQPGRPVRAMVVARDREGDPIELGYSWQLNGMRVEGKGPEIVFSELSRGDEVKVSVVATDGRGRSEPTIATGRVGNRPPRILDLTIHTRGKQDGEGGEWVVDPIAEDPDGDLVEFDYTWRIGSRIVGREQALDRSGWTRGDEIVVSVVARDRDDASEVVDSAPIVIGNSAPEIVSKPPGLDRSGTFSYQVKASDPDGDRGLRYSLGEAPDGMEVDAFGGLVTWHASLENEGEHKVEVIVDDRKGATTKQVFFLTVQTSRRSSPASPR
jgi:hypothetical protein